jgi:hypothetical protein
LVTLARGSPSLFFVKANYFLVGLVLAAVSLVWSGCLEWRRMAAMAAGFCAAALPFLAYLRFHAGAVLADLQTAANARGGQLSPRLACRCSWRIYRAW